MESRTLRRRLAFRSPLGWEAMLGFFRMRATPGVEVASEDTYRRTIEVGGRPGTLEVRPLGGGRALALRAEIPASADAKEIVTRTRRLFDLDADPIAIARRLRRSAPLARRLPRGGGLRVPGAWDGFELAVRAVLGQQITVRAATTLAGRIARAYGTELGKPRRGLSHLFPRPEALAEADFAGIGLTRSRAATLRALATAVARGKLSIDAGHGLDDFVRRMTAIPGIGEWTAQYVAMRACREPDAFPSSDLGLLRALGNGRGPVSRAELERSAEEWRPWRAYAAICLWTSEAPKEDSR
jgi:AraC family transcriptional regulator of adaptative response / DNA-3-methyladenine glycosylase II